MLPNEWERSEWRVPNTPRWEGDLVDRTTGVHRNSHSASREQPQSRRTGERSIRRNIPVIRTIPCVQIVCPRGHPCSIPNKIFRGLDYLGSASNVQTHGTTLSEKAHSIAEQDEQAKCGSSEVRTSYGIPLKTTKAAEQVRRDMVTARQTRQLPAETSPVVLVMAAHREAGLDRNRPSI